MIKGQKKIVSVVMPLELYNTLKELAEQDRRSVPSYIRIIMLEHVQSRK